MKYYLCGQWLGKQFLHFFMRLRSFLGIAQKLLVGQIDRKLSSIFEKPYDIHVIFGSSQTIYNESSSRLYQCLYRWLVVSSLQLPVKKLSELLSSDGRLCNSILRRSKPAQNPSEASKSAALLSSRNSLAYLFSVQCSEFKQDSEKKKSFPWYLSKAKG